MWFEGLHSIDLFVANPGRMATALIDRLGFQPPHELASIVGEQNDDGFYSVQGYGSDVAWLRLSQWTDRSLEIIAMRPFTPFERDTAASARPNSSYGQLPATMIWQGNRPVKSHAVSPKVPDEDLGELVKFWDKVGVPYVITLPNEVVPIPTILVGFEGDPLRFLPEKALLPWQWASAALFDVGPGIPDKARWMEKIQAMVASVPAPQPVADEPPEGALLSVIAQSFVVPSVDQALQTLRAMNTGSSGDDAEVQSLAASRRATFHSTASDCASLELVEPTTDEGRVSRYHATYGAGPFAIRLGTRSLDAYTAELQQRDTRWSVDTEVENRILIDPTQLCGAEIEVEQL